MHHRGQEWANDSCQELSKNPDWASVKHHLPMNCRTFSTCCHCQFPANTNLHACTAAIDSSRQQVCESHHCHLKEVCEGHHYNASQCCRVRQVSDEFGNATSLQICTTAIASCRLQLCRSHHCDAKWTLWVPSLQCITVLQRLEQGFRV